MAAYKLMQFVVNKFCLRNGFILQRRLVIHPMTNISLKCCQPSTATMAMSQSSRPRLFTASLIFPPRTHSLLPNCCEPIARKTTYSLPKFSQFCSFHTTQPRRAIPPALWPLIRPIANLAAVMFGRLFRKLWGRLSQDQRDKIILKIKKNKNKLMGTLGVLFIGLLLYILAHIKEVPYTKRRRFILFSLQDMRHLCTAVEDKILSTNETLSHRHPFYRRVEKIMAKLIEANQSEILESGVSSWVIHVIDQPEINNAMVLPNGTVFVFSGMIETCASDDQLGTVLAHEIAHVLLNHQGEALSKEQFSSLSFLLLITAIWAVLPNFAAIVSHIFASNTSALLVHLPFSRRMETEADRVGLNLAAKACLDVRQASVLWAKMALREELGCAVKILEFLSSHPSHETRQKALDELIPDALKLREMCKCESLRSADPRIKFSAHSELLKEAKLKGCLSCESVFSSYDL